MAIGFVDFVDGQVFEASHADGILRQTIMSFAGSSERDTALSGNLEEGMHAYLRDTNAVTWYTGSVWRTLFSQPTSFTPSWGNTTVGNGTSTGYYQYTPDGIRVRAALTFGSTTAFTGTATLTVPNSEMAASGMEAMGNARFVDDSTAANTTTGTCTITAGSGSITPQASTGSTVINSSAPFTWATGDILRLDIVVPL